MASQSPPAARRPSGSAASCRAAPVRLGNRTHRNILGAAILGLLAGCAATPYRPGHAIAPGARYVAMGSSFAAGPGIAPGEEPKNRCGRSANNYAHQLASIRKLDLVDVSCGGATTKNVLEKWNELPAQVDSITPETRLVTITIGGNDVGYIGSLVDGSLCQLQGGSGPACSRWPPRAQPDWQGLLRSLTQVAAEARRRAPEARIVFVDYLTILPAEGDCAATRMSPDRAAWIRSHARSIAEVTARAARESKAELLAAGSLSLRHDACSSQPYVAGFPYAGAPPMGAPYHPTREGMAMIARELDLMLSRRPA